MPFFTHDGNKHYYEDSGGDGPAIVFSHGAFLDQTIWAADVAELAPAHRGLTLPACDDGSSEAHGVFSCGDAANVVIALLDELGIDRAVLDGVSQGGWTSQRAAIASPDRVRGVVLQGTSVRLLSPEEMTGF